MYQDTRDEVSLAGLQGRDRIMAQAYMARAEFLAAIITGVGGLIAKAVHSVAHVAAHPRDGLAH